MFVLCRTNVPVEKIVRFAMAVAILYVNAPVIRKLKILRKKSGIGNETEGFYLLFFNFMDLSLNTIFSIRIPLFYMKRRL